MLIAEHKTGRLMNRKGEWGQNLHPEFGILGSEEPGKHLMKKRDRTEVQQPGVGPSSNSTESPAKRKRMSVCPSVSDATPRGEAQIRQSELEGEVQNPPNGSQADEPVIVSNNKANQSKAKLGLSRGRIIFIKQDTPEVQQNQVQLEGSEEGQREVITSNQKA